MNFKLPIYHFGISTSIDGSIKIAILQKTCKEWILIDCKQVTSKGECKLPKFSLSTTSSLSLPGSISLAKSFFSCLKKKRNILRIALADLENSSAFPLSSLSIAPLFGQADPEKGDTPLTLWLVQKTKIEEQILALQPVQLCPDTISCTPLDLFALLQNSALKILPSYFFLFAGVEEISCLLVINGAVSLARSFPADNSCCKAIVETIQYAQTLSAKTPFTEIYAAYLPKQLEEELSSLLPLNIISYNPLSQVPVQWGEFREAILSAYQGVSKQANAFSYSFVQHAKVRTQWLKKNLRFLGQCTCLSTLVFSFISTFKLSTVRNQVKENYAITFPNQPALPNNLTQSKQLLDQACSQIPTNYPYLPTILSSQECLNVLDTLTEQLPSIRFNYFKYTITQKPSQTEPNVPYIAIVHVKGEGSQSDITSFKHKLSKHPQLKNMKAEVCGENMFNITCSLFED